MGDAKVRRLQAVAAVAHGEPIAMSDDVRQRFIVYQARIEGARAVAGAAVGAVQQIEAEFATEARGLRGALGIPDDVECVFNTDKGVIEVRRRGSATGA